MAQILYFQGSWWDYISFTLPYKTCMFSKIFVFLLKSGCLFPPNQHVDVKKRLSTNFLSFFTPSLCWDPSSLHCLTHRRGSCPPCYRNWAPRSPSRLLPPLPSKCPCASGRQAQGRWGEAAKKAYFWGEILCISQGTWWTPTKWRWLVQMIFLVQLGEILGSMWIFRDVWSNDVWFDVCICWLGLLIIISSCGGIYLEYRWCALFCSVRNGPVEIIHFSWRLGGIAIQAFVQWDVLKSHMTMCDLSGQFITANPPRSPPKV